MSAPGAEEVSSGRKNRRPLQSFTLEPVDKHGYMAE